MDLFIALILALASFGMILSEFIPLGMFADLSLHLNVTSEQLITLANLHPIILIISAPIMGLIVGKVRKKLALSIHIALFIIGNLISLSSTDYMIFAVGRVISVIATGGFLGLGIVYVAEKAEESKKFFSISLMFMAVGMGGISASIIGKTLGLNFGWMTPFILPTILAFISLIVILLSVENEETKSIKTTISEEVKMMFSKSILITILATMLGAIGFNIIASNLMTVLVDGAHVSESHLGLVYMLFVIGAFLGVILCGKACDINLQRTSIFTLVAVAVFSGLLSFMMHSPMIAVLLLFLIVLSINMVGMTCVAGMTSNSKEAPNMSTCGLISSFQLSGIIGGAIASFALHKNFPMNTLPGWCAVFAILSVSVVLWTVYCNKKKPVVEAQTY